MPTASKQTKPTFHILIVEDEAMLRQVYAEVLQIEGYKVSVAADGEEGLAMLSKTKPDLVLLDILMPKVDGLGFLRQAHLAKKYPRTKVLALSNLSDISKMNDMVASGASKHILKSSLSPKQLVAEVRSFLKTV